MEPMMKYISNEMERLVLTNEQLAQKRGQDFGEDYFKDGQKASVSISICAYELLILFVTLVLNYIPSCFRESLAWVQMEIS